MYTPLRTLRGHRQCVWDVAATNDYIYSAGWDGKVLEWDANNGNMCRDFKGHDGQVWSVDVDVKNEVLLTAGEDRTVRVWAAAQGEASEEGGAYGKCLGTIEGTHESPVYFVKSISTSNEAIVCVTGSQDGSIKQWTVDRAEGFQSKSTTLASCHDGGVTCAARNDAAKLLATSGSDTCIKVFSYGGAGGGLELFLKIGEERNADLGHNAAVSSLAFGTAGGSGSGDASPTSTNPNLLLSGSWDGNARLWDIRAPAAERCASSWGAHRQNVSGVAFYGDTVCMTASSDDQDGLKVWDLRRLQKVFKASKKGEKRYVSIEPLQAMDNHINTVCQLTSLPNGSQIVSASSDRTLIQWYANVPPLEKKPTGKVACCTVS
eukprot:g2459.t1